VVSTTPVALGATPFALGTTPFARACVSEGDTPVANPTLRTLAATQGRLRRAASHAHALTLHGPWGARACENSHRASACRPQTRTLAELGEGSARWA
jgi:hypothetical protein